jgi:hypothetical protein
LPGARYLSVAWMRNVVEDDAWGERSRDARPVETSRLGDQVWGPVKAAAIHVIGV